jgi:segregation and condensation protein A
MEYKAELEQFQGPLDLLLQLIQGKEMDISQVSLAEVTDQYLAYLDSSKNISATDLADFLVVATKLLVIKSKTLMPQLADDEDDSAEQLEAQLKMYKDYLDASKNIEKMLGKQNILFSREKMAVNFEPTFSPPASLKVDELKDLYQEILGRVDYVINLPKKVMAKAVSLKETVAGIRQRIDQFKKLNFSDVIKSAASKTEVVVSFMAILELLKAGEIAVNQQGVFDEIYVEKS